ncbi:putative Transmembrane protein [Quillaja saponaria]|uniref:Transmembrane protein n=1 Tax=Quillaja saponaria TaxID=32244 RepID=A0AAD7L648_QUISA|nr:putative Transmembrane protein [Quillaja saponaria]
MWNIKTMAFLLQVLTSLLILTIFLPLCHGVGQSYFPPTKHVQGYYNVVSRVMRKSLQEGTNAKPMQNSSLILAADATRRVDPSNNFNYYTGGWNFSDVHYMKSVGHTGSLSFIIAAIWFFIGACLIILAPGYCCSSTRHQFGYSQIAYSVSLFLLITFMITTLIGSAILHRADAGFFSTKAAIVKSISKQVDKTVGTLTNVSCDLAAAERVEVNLVSLPPDVQEKAKGFMTRSNISAINYEFQTHKSKNKSPFSLNELRQVFAASAALVLTLAIIGFVLSYFGWQYSIYILMVIGWIIIAIALVDCGFSLVVHKATAHETLSLSREVTSQLVSIVNDFITNVANKEANHQEGHIYYNQSGKLLPNLCNPYDFEMRPREYVAGEVELKAAEQVWKTYICNVSSSGNCTTMGRLTPTFYKQMVEAVNVSSALYRSDPFLESLVDCKNLQQIFSDINKYYCPGLIQNSSRIHVGLVIMTAAVMCSMSLWLIFARERVQRFYAKRVIIETTRQDSKAGENLLY